MSVDTGRIPLSLSRPERIQVVRLRGWASCRVWGHNHAATISTPAVIASDRRAVNDNQKTRCR